MTTSRTRAFSVVNCVSASMNSRKALLTFEDVDFPTQGGSTRLASGLSSLDLDSAGLNCSDFDHLASLPPSVALSSRLPDHDASYFRSLWERRAIFRRKRVQRCEIVLNRAERVRLGQRIGPKMGTQLYAVR